MKTLILALATTLLSISTLAREEGGSSTVGAIGPAARASLAFDKDEKVLAEVQSLEAKGFEKTGSYAESVKIESFHCRQLEGRSYTICDQAFLVERKMEKIVNRKVKTQTIVRRVEMRFDENKNKSQFYVLEASDEDIKTGHTASRD